MQPFGSFRGCGACRRSRRRWRRDPRQQPVGAGDHDRRRGWEPIGCGAGGLWSPLGPPSGTPENLFPINPSAFYDVQGVHKWQAQCTGVAKGAPIHVVGEWGDNLTGEAKLKAGSPIRVELLMFDESALHEGYSVVKLEPAT